LNDDNLIPRSRLERKRWKARLRLWIYCAGVYAGVVIATTAIAHATWSQDDRQLDGELAVATARIDEQTSLEARLQQELSEARVRLEADRAIGEPPDWSVLLALLGEETNDSVVLNSCGLTAVGPEGIAPGQRRSGPSAGSPSSIPLGRRRFRVELSGFGRTQTDVSQFLLRLEQVGLFRTVRLMQSDRAKFLDGEAVVFRVECTV